jgi:hypothetical protein
MGHWNPWSHGGMKIGIYHELTEGDEPGGAERCVSTVAEALQESHRVEIVNHCPSLDLEALATFAGVNLKRVRPPCSPHS